MLLPAGALVLGGHVDDAVGVDVEGDLDLGVAPAGGQDAVQHEYAQLLVVLGHLPLALEHLDLHGGLVVGVGGEHLAAVGGDGGVAVDDLGHDAAGGLDTQGQGGDVQQQQVLHVAGEHAALEGRAHGHALVGVDALKAVPAGDVLHRVLDCGDAAGAAHQEDLVQVAGGELGVPHGLADGAHGGLHQMVGQLIELGPGQGQVQMLGAGGIGGDIGQVDGGGGHAGQLDLGLLGGLLEALHGNFIAGQIHTLGLLELGHHPVHDTLVKVVAAQAVVAGGGQHLDDAVVNVQDGHVEGAAAQVVDHNLLGFFLVHAVGQSGGGGLVDDALDLQTGDFSRVLGGLALGVGEVGGDGNHRFGDRLAQVALGVRLQLLENHGTDLLGGVVLAVHGDTVVGAHLPLDGADGPVGVGDGLALGHLAHHALAVLGEGHDGGGGAVALGVGDDDGVAALHHRNAAIGST